MSQSSREEGNSSFQSMENGNGHDHLLQIQGPPVLEKQRPPKKSSNHTYNECQKNHAAALGKDTRDGCGEFMPGGAEGTLEALNCAACNCHRNFHRKEAIEEDEDGDHEMVAPELVGYPTNFQMMPSPRAGMTRKRARTKFTKEQKVKMAEFAKRVGWKLQRMEDSVVEKFCEETGITRRVLKVWMQNNKHVHLGINRNNNNLNNNNNNGSNSNSNNNGNSSSSNQI